MPQKNIVKQYVDESYYHIYSRGINKELVFREKEDFEYFLSLLKRYLSDGTLKNGARVAYPGFSGISLLSFCLMQNHIHLLIYQDDAPLIGRFMKSLMTSYGMYFNKKYQRIGPVFQSSYKATLIDSDSYLHHISRYIHLNPRRWRSYQFSSLAYLLGEKHASWMKTDRIMALFDYRPQKYLQFVEDYEDNKQMYDELRWELAN